MDGNRTARSIAGLVRQIAKSCVVRVVLHTAPGHERTVWLGLVRAGARRFRRVLHYDGEPPYVIDVAELTLSGLVIEAHAPPRPASPGERAALESDEAFSCIDSCRVVEINHVD